MSKMADDAAIEAEEKRRELKECPFCEESMEFSVTEMFLHADGFEPELYRVVVHCNGCEVEVARETRAEAIAAWNRRSGEGLKLKAGEEYTILCDTMWVDQYNTLLADVERVIADAIKYEWREGMILDKLDTVLTRILDQHKEHNVSGT